MSFLPKSDQAYEITASLLNSWQRIADSASWVKESENDTVSYEDKVAEAAQKAKEEFLSVLRREPIPDNEAMRKGREFEADVYAGLDPVFSPIAEGGEAQAAYSKVVYVNGIKIVLYGILDLLKAGRIYDIKRVGYYSYPKYKTSHQHPMYLELVPTALDFTYLIKDDRGEYHTERYERCNCEDVKDAVASFLSWLEANGLMDTFMAHWNWNERKKGKL